MGNEFPEQIPMCCNTHMRPAGGELGDKPKVRFWMCDICLQELTDTLEYELIADQ